MSDGGGCRASVREKKCRPALLSLSGTPFAGILKSRQAAYERIDAWLSVMTSCGAARRLPTSARAPTTWTDAAAYLQKLNQFRFYKSAAKIHFLIETAKEF